MRKNIAAVEISPLYRLGLTQTLRSLRAPKSVNRYVAQKTPIVGFRVLKIGKCSIGSCLSSSLGLGRFCHACSTWRHLGNVSHARWIERAESCQIGLAKSTWVLDRKTVSNWYRGHFPFCFLLAWSKINFNSTVARKSFWQRGRELERKENIVKSNIIAVGMKDWAFRCFKTPPMHFKWYQVHSICLQPISSRQKSLFHDKTIPPFRTLTQLLCSNCF